MRQRTVGLRERAVQSQGPQRCLFRLRHLYLRHTAAEYPIARASVGDPGVGARECRIERESALEMLQRTRQGGSSLAVQQKAALEVEIVRFRAGGRAVNRSSS